MKFKSACFVVLGASLAFVSCKERSGGSDVAAAGASATQGGEGSATLIKLLKGAGVKASRGKLSASVRCSTGITISCQLENGEMVDAKLFLATIPKFGAVGPTMAKNDLEYDVACEDAKNTCVVNGKTEMVGKSSGGSSAASACGNPMKESASAALLNGLVASGISACEVEVGCSSGMTVSCMNAKVDGKAVALKADLSAAILKFRATQLKMGMNSVKVKCDSSTDSCTVNGKADPTIAASSSGSTSSGAASVCGTATDGSHSATILNAFTAAGISSCNVDVLCSYGMTVSCSTAKADDKTVTLKTDLKAAITSFKAGQLKMGINTVKVSCDSGACTVNGKADPSL